MAHILLGIEHGVEVAAEDVLKFVSGAVVAGNKATPGVVAGLGVLLGTVAKTLGDISGVVANPLNFHWMRRPFRISKPFGLQLYSLPDRLVLSCSRSGMDQQLRGGAVSVM